MFKFLYKIKELHDRFKAWKPIHLCWWFEKHNLPIPPYLIGGGNTIRGAYKQTRNDDPSSTDRPGSTTIIQNQGDYFWVDRCIGQKIHVRILIATDSKDVTLNLAPFFYVVGVGDYSTGSPITTDGSVNPVKIAPSTGGASLSDSIPCGYGYWVSTSYYGTKTEGWYIQSSDQFPPLNILAADGWSEVQFCVEVTENAVIRETYGLYVKHADGTDFYSNSGGFIEIIDIPTTTISFDSAWKILQVNTASLQTAWGTRTKQELSVGWRKHTLLLPAWGIANKRQKETSWKTGRYYVPVSWNICTEARTNVSWKTGRYYVPISWKILSATFDIEWEEEATQTPVGSASDVIDSEFVLTGLKTSTTYRWRVRVHDLHNSGSPSGWSYWAIFTTEPLTLPLSWRVSATKTKGNAWRITRGAMVEAAWNVFVSQEKKAAYRISAKSRQDVLWYLLAKGGTDTAWQVEETIPSPINRNTIEITKISARFIWEPR